MVHAFFIAGVIIKSDNIENTAEVSQMKPYKKLYRFEKSESLKQLI